ncbi:MAG: crossover junction endodeoxyribonuclease RuvC [Candidatus Sericytochromatia bacterium]
MLVLGIDPGTATVGYGLLEIEGNDIKSILNYGIIQTPSKIPMQKRLKMIFDDMNELIETFKPDIMAIEELFFFKNSKTVITVSQARGVILLSATINNLEIYEYTPLQVKIALTGYGRADKNEVQNSVKDILNLEKIPKPDDAADALAIAICHQQHIMSLN